MDTSSWRNQSNILVPDSRWVLTQCPQPMLDYKQSNPILDESMSEEEQTDDEVYL
jgi:hypothetical protein